MQTTAIENDRDLGFDLHFFFIRSLLIHTFSQYFSLCRKEKKGTTTKAMKQAVHCVSVF